MAKSDTLPRAAADTDELHATSDGREGSRSTWMAGRMLRVSISRLEG